LDEFIRQRMYDPFREAELLKHEVKDISTHQNGVSETTNGIIDSVKGAVAGAHL
jgi:hypothetical protein